MPQTRVTGGADRNNKAGRMRRLIGTILAILCAAGAAAQDTTLRTLDTGEVSRGWEAVGRLDIDRAGFCTASLISEYTILTAAHCLFDDNGLRIAPERFSFLAGLRDGRASASRMIIRATPHPAYVHRGEQAQDTAVAVDLAVLELDRPVRLPSLAPYAIGAAPLRGAAVAVVSYARERANAASLQRTCHVLDQVDGVVMMTCAADFGASGAPIFGMDDGIARIVSVVSAKGTADGQPVSLAASLSGTLDAVLVAHRTGSTPVIVEKPLFTSSGTRNDTGAKFVRP